MPINARTLVEAKSVEQVQTTQYVATVTAVLPITSNALSPMLVVEAVGVVVLVDQFAVAASGA